MRALVPGEVFICLFLLESSSRICCGQWFPGAPTQAASETLGAGTAAFRLPELVLGSRGWIAFEHTIDQLKQPP